MSFIVLFEDEQEYAARLHQECQEHERQELAEYIAELEEYYSSDWQESENLFAIVNGSTPDSDFNRQFVQSFLI